MTWKIFQCESTASGWRKDVAHTPTSVIQPEQMMQFVRGKSSYLHYSAWRKRLKHILNIQMLLLTISSDSKMYDLCPGVISNVSGDGRRRPCPWRHIHVPRDQPPLLFKFDPLPGFLAHVCQPIFSRGPIFWTIWGDTSLFLPDLRRLSRWHTRNDLVNVAVGTVVNLRGIVLYTWAQG